jgi:hypothetical protein
MAAYNFNRALIILFRIRKVTEPDPYLARTLTTRR